MSERIERCCDLVMRGGITSGIVYPPAISRIAERFYFKSIGGTSAGAIAACATAAAEYRRRHGSDEGFALLERLPRDLGKGGKLTALFQPDARTRSLHRFARRVMDLKSSGFVSRLWTYASIGWFLLRRESKLRPLIENDLGLCSGMANGMTAETEPLTVWLSRCLDEIAGKEDGEPLTFRDLWTAPEPESIQATTVGSVPIQLKTVTTSLSFSRPFAMPFEDRIFAFDPDEWADLFPDYVMKHLIREAESIDSSLRRDGKLPLPIGEAMPVIVAARMSLSFPGLFSMVPLYAVNYEERDQPLKKVWFSDGGITSNFPIHFSLMIQNNLLTILIFYFSQLFFLENS